MNILVYDVAAENRGAATILEYYYNKHLKDKDNQYYYLLSVYKLESTNNITVINVPKVKKSWGRRLWFDYIGVRKYIKKYKIDEVLSLQNIIIPFFSGKQTVYEHNALPFSEHKFGLKESRILWLYQNILGKYMLWSIKKAAHVIVQTEWMKKAIVERTGVDEHKIEVQFPEIEIPKGYSYHKDNVNNFFYPANYAIYKNHKVVLDACKNLKEKGVTNYRILFTLDGDESEQIAEIRREANQAGINIVWLGTLSRQDVFVNYCKSVLLFPSFVETVGLPIYEAMLVGSPMLLSDCEYAKDLAGEYKKAKFFKYNSGKELSKLMEEIIRTV